MEQLQRYDKDGIEILINIETGESFATQAGYSRMSGVEYSVIRNRVARLKGRIENPLPTTEILTPGGVQVVSLLNEDVIAEWLVKDNPKIASKLMKLGIRHFLHEAAGYKVTSTAIEVKPKSALELAKENLKLCQTQIELLEEIEKINEENKQLVVELCEQKPLVKLAETLVKPGKDLVTIGEFAKAIGMGRNEMFEYLREIEFLMKGSRLPYQKYVNLGYAQVIRKERSFQQGVFDGVTLLTAKGQKWIAEKLTNTEKQLVEF